MSDRKRQRLKDKVNMGEHRLRERQGLAERAAEARDSAVGFAKENPLLIIAGGLALGVAVSMLFSRSPTRKAAEKGVKKGAGLAMLAVELALPFIQQAMTSAGDAGRSGIDRLEDLGEAAGGKARSLGRSAAERAGETIDAARGTGRRLVKSVRR